MIYSVFDPTNLLGWTLIIKALKKGFASLVTRPLVTRDNKFPWIVANPSSEGLVNFAAVS
jgi:hypothetical protein